MTYILLIIIGLCGGFTIAGGVFALISAIGLIPRLADKTRTARYIKSYETAIFYGGTLGNLFSLIKFQWNIPFYHIIFCFTGLFIGIFIGCLATSLAESLQVTAIFSRRLKLHHGLGFIVLFTALGKLIGSLLYFIIKV